MRNPTLVFIAHLMGAVDAAHSEDHRREPIGARIIDDVLIRRAFRAAIGAVQIERT